MSRPKNCGICQFFLMTPEGGFCVPLTEKYGAEPVYENQSPSVNCHYEYSSEILKMMGV